MTDNIELIKLSASSMKTYEQCPRKYYYNYINKAKTKNWEHFDLGNLCHETLEMFHKSYMKEGTSIRTLSKMMSSSFELSRAKFPKMRHKLVSDAKEMMQDYLKKMKKEGMPLVKGVEAKFNFHITDDILVRGFVDRLDIMKDGRFCISDYKTTKNAKYLDEFQLLIYGLWLKKEYPHVESFTGSYVLLRHGSKLKKYDFNMEDVEKVKKKIIMYAEKIKNEDTWAPVPTILCNWCDFKDICPTNKTW